MDANSGSRAEGQSSSSSSPTTGRNQPGKKKRGNHGGEDLDRYSSVQEEKRRKADEMEAKWRKLPGLEKVFRFYDADPTAEVLFGLTALRQGRAEGPLVLSSSSSRSKAQQPQEENSQEEDAARPRDEHKSSSRSQGRKKETSPAKSNSNEPAAQQQKRALSKQETTVSTYSGGAAKTTQQTTYVSSSGVHYDENGEPLMRFFAYDPSVHMKKRALTPGAEYASNHSLKLSAARRERQQGGAVGSSSYHNKSGSTAHADQSHQQQHHPPLKTVMESRRPYGRYDALAILEDAATDQKFLSAAHIAFTPCPSQFNATSVRDRNKSEAGEREKREKVKASAFKKEQREGEKQRKKVMLTPTPRSPTEFESTTTQQEEQQRYQSPSRSRTPQKISRQGNDSRSSRRAASPAAASNAPGTRPGSVAVYGAEGTLGGVIRQKTQRREASSQHDSVSKVLQAKRTPGAMHLGKVLDRIEGRFQRTLNPLSEKDSRRMLQELQIYQDQEDSDRRGQDLDHLKRFGREKPQKEITSGGGGTGERSHFDLQLTSLGGGGVKPLVRRQRRRYGSQV